MEISGPPVLAVTILLLILLVKEKASLDAIGIGVLVALVAIGECMRLISPGFDPAASLISAKDALAGFGNSAVLTIASLYVIGEGLTRTGAVEFIARWVMKFSANKERRMVFLVALIAGVLSAFLNNTGVVVVFIPILIGMAKDTGVAASRLMIPLAYASILGGTVTLVGTSTNLLVSGVAEDAGYAPLGMFEMTAVGGVILLAGVLFIAIFVRRLLPKRQSLSTMMAGPGSREYVTELTISPQSPLLGQAYDDVFSSSRAELLFFAREDTMVMPPYAGQNIEHGDVIMLRGNVDTLAGLQDEFGLRLLAESRFDPKSMQFFELALAPHSSIVGRTVGDVHLWRDYGAILVAVLRDGRHIRERASKQVLHVGDLLLVSGDEESQNRIRAKNDFFLLTGAHDWVVLRGKARVSLGIVLGVMVAFGMCSMGSVGHLLPVIALFGALAMVASGCLTTRKAYQAIDWPILMFIVGTIGLGRAMEQSGVASFLAGGIVDSLIGMGAVAVLGGLLVVCGVLTNFISNQAVAVLLTPIAIGAAKQVESMQGLSQAEFDPMLRAFILAVAFGSSISFATPVGHQSNLMVYGPGGYKFGDYLKMGIPISILVLILAFIGIPLLTGMGF
ncbi:MAG: SLC13 family permease [Planctomycetes bacterium]|nr:SLC13 family permease [Planctomycetota bacterium]